jgi:transposase InsO family protein
MGVSRAGYYKWKKRGKPAYQDKREQVIALVTKIHTEHPSHGYRWVAAFIQINEGVSFSDNYVYKAFRFLGFQSETKHKEHSRPRKVKDKYPNLIYTTWDTVDRPRQVIVSDMTVLHVWAFYIEVTFYFDVFTKQILTWKMAERRGDRNQYIDGMADIVDLLRGSKEPTIVHTDQGTVYASVAYNDLIKDVNIQRSMSRAGTPTDNPVNESLNGWIKEELYMDFHLDGCRSRDAIRNTIESYVAFYNKQRPCYAIGYDTPDHYYQRFQRGELEKKDTFSKRVLTTEPKFVQKRRQQKLRDKENQGIEGIRVTVSTSENGNEEKMSLVSTSENVES